CAARFRRHAGRERSFPRRHQGDRMNRTATITRTTKETSVAVTLDLDGTGASRIDTPVGFLSHMLDTIARHSRTDLDVIATGDTHIDYHHTVEDIGLVLGETFAAALGDKRGIRRFGHAYVPLDEAVARGVSACSDGQSDGLQWELSNV